MLNIIGLSTLILIFTTLLAYFISKRFYNRFTSSLNELQRLTNEINLESLDTNFKENEYYEFQQVIISYNNMLKRLKEQTQKQIDFVNNASHELKTPIFVISGYVDLIKRWGYSNKELVEESLDAIGEESKNMANLVNKLLFLAKDEENYINEEEINLKDLIINIVKDLKILYPFQEIEIIISEEYTIISDNFLLKQLLINLIENAVKYGNKKKVTIILKKDKNITIEIIDRGKGISEENLNKIFEKFYRENKARSREEGSQGLGLSIVKKIANILNINIEIESKIGIGSTVKIMFKK